MTAFIKHQWDKGSENIMWFQLYRESRSKSASWSSSIIGSHRATIIKLILVKSKDVTIENDLISQRKTEAYALMKTEMNSSSEQEIFTWSVKIIKKGFQTNADQIGLTANQIEAVTHWKPILVGLL